MKHYHIWYFNDNGTVLARSIHAGYESRLRAWRIGREQAKKSYPKGFKVLSCTDDCVVA